MKSFSFSESFRRRSEPDEACKWTFLHHAPPRRWLAVWRQKENVCREVKIKKTKSTIGPISQRQRKNAGCLLRHPHKIEEITQTCFKKLKRRKIQMKRRLSNEEERVCGPCWRLRERAREAATVWRTDESSNRASGQTLWCHSGSSSANRQTDKWTHRRVRAEIVSSRSFVNDEPPLHHSVWTEVAALALRHSVCFHLECRHAARPEKPREENQTSKI